MGKLILREIADPDLQDLERAKRFMSLDATSKIKELFALIDLSIKFNGGKPIKLPQGKGLVLRKLSKCLILLLPLFLFSCYSEKSKEQTSEVVGVFSIKNSSTFSGKQYSDTIWVKNDSQRFLLKVLKILTDSAMGHSLVWTMKERTQFVDRGLKNGYLINNDEFILNRKFKSDNNFYTTVNDGTWEFSIFEIEKEKCIILTHGTVGDGDEFFAFEYDNSKLVAIQNSEILLNSLKPFYKEGRFEICNQTLKNNKNDIVWLYYSFWGNKITVGYDFDKSEKDCLKGDNIDLNFNKKTKRFDVEKIYWDTEK